MDESFHSIEEQSGVVPFQLGGDSFNKKTIPVDGIYQPYSRFFKAVNDPLNHEDKIFTRIQDSARKDIECIFGLLKGFWQITHNVICLQKLEDISKWVNSCLIIHDKLVSDHVMGDPRKLYDPV